MRKLLFFFLAAFAVSPVLAGCVGLPNPQTEWTTTEGVGDQPPVSSIQGSIDLTPLEDLDVDFPDREHREHGEHRERADARAAETKHVAAHPGVKTPDTGRAGRR